MNRNRWFIIAFVVIAGCIVTEYVSHQRVVPPDHVKSLAAFLEWRPSINEFTVVNVNGSEHVIAYGPWSGILLLPSGPSAYVFDRSGKFVDWSSDIGDDSVFDNRWQA